MRYGWRMGAPGSRQPPIHSTASWHLAFCRYRDPPHWAATAPHTLVLLARPLRLSAQSPPTFGTPGSQIEPGRCIDRVDAEIAAFCQPVAFCGIIQSQMEWKSLAACGLHKNA